MTESKFWADQTAAAIIKSRDKYVINTGITPSGQIHIGNMREVLTGDVINRVLKQNNKEVVFNYVADDNDALRKVYPFLNDSYEEHVGKPLYKIPCPCGKHKSYSEHYLEPFLTSLKTLGVEANIIRASDLYEQGLFNKVVIEALENVDVIKRILHEETGKEMDDLWSPFLPICDKCGRNTTTKLTGFNADNETIDYQCECGDKNTLPIAGNGKLTWRIDWPARWSVMNVSIEPFGKDHASRGGSYDTGKRIIKEVFKKDAPFPIIYEWISLKGQGDMSSSKGNVISIAEMLNVVPPEVLRYMVFKGNPKKAISFDPGIPLFNLINEYDDTASNKNERAYELSQISGVKPVGIPYKHMVNLTQITEDNVDKIVDILNRTGFDASNKDAISSRAKYARGWVDRFAPKEAKFEIQKKLPVEAKNLSENQIDILKNFKCNFKKNMTGEEIHNLLYTIIKEKDLTPKDGFEAIYTIFLGKNRGPKAGWFLETLGYDFVMKRLSEIS